MNPVRCSNIRISFTNSLYVYMALLLLLLPFRLLFAILISMSVHELFHIIAMRIMGIRIYAIQIGVRGAILETETMTEKQELVCALAGPAGGFLLLFLFRLLPAAAMIGLIHSLYNLLPIYPADGGRALQSLTRLMLPGNRGERIIYTVEVITLSMMMAICIYSSVWLKLGILPVVFGVMALLRSARRK